MKKINICPKELDVDKLCTEITKYEASYFDDAYLFMNRHTIKSLFFSISNNIKTTKDVPEINNNAIAAHFRGHKIFCDDALEYGEVEIR